MNLSSQGAEIVGAEMTPGDKVSIVTAISTGVSNLASSIWGPKAVAGQAKEPLPAWVMPVTIGGIGVIALTLFAGLKK